MQMFGSFAKFERTMVRERTHAGLQAAKAHGRQGGCCPKLLSQQKTEILSMLDAGCSAAEPARSPPG